MKAIGGARRPGASGVSFGGACGGVGVRDEASSREESGGELGVGIWCGGSLSMILPNTQSINGLKWVSQLHQEKWYLPFNTIYCYFSLYTGLCA